MQKVVVIGAGPAGLTAAYELLRRSKDFRVVVLEESQSFGGVSPVEFASLSSHPF